MIILGIDPGSRTTGYGVIKRTGKVSIISTYGNISTSSHQSVSERLEKIYDGLSAVIKKWTPDVAALEEIFFSKNVRSTLILGQARGVALLALAKAHIPYYEYSARKVKQGVTGSGAASKEQIQFMVKKIFKIDDTEMGADAADAIAIAFCHTNSMQFREQIRL